MHTAVNWRAHTTGTCAPFVQKPWAGPAGSSSSCNIPPTPTPSPEVRMQSWMHMLGLVLPNYSHWCWKTFRPRKLPKGLWALVAAKQAGFHATATGEMHKGQMVCHNICFLRGQPEDSLHVGSLGQKLTPEKPWNTKGSKLSPELLHGSGQPQVSASWSPLWLKCALLGPRAFPLMLLLFGISHSLRHVSGHALTLCVGQVVSK